MLSCNKWLFIITDRCVCPSIKLILKNKAVCKQKKICQEDRSLKYNTDFKLINIEIPTHLHEEY